MTDSVPYLQVDVEPAPGEVIVRVVGEIDAATAPQLAQGLRQAAEAGEAVALDLAGVSFIDSSGLRVVTRRPRLGAGARADVRGLRRQCAGAQDLLDDGLDGLLARG